MESFFKKHFRKNTASSGPRRSNVVALPASKARRRSLVGQPSVALVQRRRSSSTQFQGLSCLGSQRKRRSNYRRRSSTTTPRLSPRFSVHKQRGGRVHVIDTHLVGPSLLLASLLQVCEEEERRQSLCAASSRSESPKEGLEERDSSEEMVSSGSEGAGLTAEQETKEPLTELSQCTSPQVQYPANLRPFLQSPRYLRRRSSHLLPAEFVHSRAAYGLQGHYQCFGPQRRTSETLKPSALLQPHGNRRAARRWKVRAGTSWLSLATHTCLRGCSSDSSEVCSALLPYVWLYEWYQAPLQQMGLGEGMIACQQCCSPHKYG